MSEIYFPSCNFTKASPEAAKRLRAYLKEKMPVAGCCLLAVGLLVGHLPAVAFRPLGSRCLLAACRRLGVCRP